MLWQVEKKKSEVRQKFNLISFILADLSSSQRDLPIKQKQMVETEAPLTKEHISIPQRDESSLDSS